MCCCILAGVRCYYCCTRATSVSFYPLLWAFILSSASRILWYTLYGNVWYGCMNVWYKLTCSTGNSWSQKRHLGERKKESRSFFTAVILCLPCSRSGLKLEPCSGGGTGSLISGWMFEWHWSSSLGAMGCATASCSSITCIMRRKRCVQLQTPPGFAFGKPLKGKQFLERRQIMARYCSEVWEPIHMWPQVPANRRLFCAVLMLCQRYPVRNHSHCLNHQFCTN